MFLRRFASVCLVALGLATVSAPAATFTVTNTLDSGPGSFRQAMNDANANPGLDFVHFNIGGGGPQTIVLNNFFPSSSGPVVIDGTTQPGFSNAPIIELSGATANTSGMFFSAHGNTIRGLLFNQCSFAIQLTGGSSSNRIEGNWFGTDLSGRVAKGIGESIIIDSGSDNIIGGTNVLARNVIAAGVQSGVSIYNGTRNSVLGNYIGTGVDGTNELGNGWTGFNTPGGVYVEGGGTNFIGGTVPGAGNLISGNKRGVVLGSQTTGNIVQGNVIGLNDAGNARLPGRAQTAAIGIFSSSGNFIGGTNAGSGNVLSGSNDGAEGYGIQMFDANWNVIQGNRIGTDITGTIAIGNRNHGIILYGVSRTNTIGGTIAAARNVISGNGEHGIQLRGAYFNFVQGNYIGTKADGQSPLGNGDSGIFLYSGNGNTIGGTTASAGNVIAYNGTNVNASYRNGVTLSQSDPSIQSTGNLVRRNSVFSNAERGIRFYDMYCYSASCSPFNDTGDSDTGPNNLQNPPVLTNAVTSGGTITISGKLNSTANVAYTIDFYASPDLDASGYGEGKTYIGSTAVVTDGTGNTGFEAFFADAGYAGQFISATATDAGKNTSEFAASVAADAAAGVIQFNQSIYNTGEAASFIMVTVVRLAGSEGTVSVHYTTADDTATAGSDYTAVSGTLTFTNGQTSLSFNVPLINDTLNEANETISLMLDSPTGGAVLGVQSNATIVIADNDPVYIYAGDSAVTKPASGTTTMFFPITLSQPCARTILVNYATANISAEAGVDYQSASGQLDFAPGVTNRIIPVTILSDGLQEGSKSFLLNLSSPTNGSFGDPQALGTIYDGTQGVLQFSATNYPGAENGGDITITVARVGGSIGSVSVPFSVAAVSATVGVDFTTTNGVLSFNNGQTTKTFTIPVLDDQISEQNETILVKLGNPTNTTLGSPSEALATILDDDPPSLSIKRSAGFVVISWPSSASDFQLLQSGSLPAANWTAVTNVPAIVDGNLTVTNSVDSSQRFYRLYR